jgi:dihydroorotate dehydrogenase (fumarate)
MANLQTKYLGVELKNPIIVGANNMVTDIASLKRMEEAGAAAIVFKSLFEEQIQLENLEMHNQMNEYSERNAEMINLFPDVEHAGPEEYLMNLANAKSSVSIPVFASLNAIYTPSWIDYAKRIEATGVDGLELNFYAFPKDFETCGKDIIAEQLEVVKEIIKSVGIPVSVKLSPFYTNILSVVKRMDDAGVKGFVLFNNLFQPDIDIETEANFYPYNLSSPSDNKLPLRYAGLLYDEIDADVCSNTGIYTGHDVVKMVMAGANVVQVVSTLYKNKIEYISTILSDLSEWMDAKGYENLDGFRGKLSKKNVNDPYAYKRSQYVDILMNSKSIFDKYPMV